MDGWAPTSPFLRQVHTFRFQGHSPADPEHERGRKDEKKWARAEADPIAIFEAAAVAEGGIAQEVRPVRLFFSLSLSLYFY